VTAREIDAALEAAINVRCEDGDVHEEILARVRTLIAAAVAEEREDAAWECDQVAKNWADDAQRPAAEECAARIRARSTEGGSNE
jgi:hypothetical protein